MIQLKVAEYHNRPFVEFLSAAGLSEKLQNFVLYAIALVNTDQSQAANQISTAEGVTAVKAYLSGIGRYGACASLVPIYGTGEIPQAFCRLCAVYGGVYMLRHGAELVMDESAQRCAGLRTTEGQMLTCQQLVCSSKYVSSYVQKSSYCYARCVCVVDGGIDPDNTGIVFAVIPPHASQNPATCFVLQLDNGVAAAPADQCTYRCIMYIF